jgi:translation initiation factor 2B subunit (eIF-2B alpha/beta/delta family)
MERVFQKILNDKTSGSAEILTNLITYLYIQVRHGKSIMQLIKTAENQLGHFAIIKNFLIKLKSIAKRNDRDALMGYLSSLKLAEKNKYLKIFNALPEKIINSRKIVTLSNSKTVFEILRLWYKQNNKFKVSVLESKPGGEGRILARKLKISGVDSELKMDSALSGLLEESDLLLMGCDIILKNGSIVNKTGSRNAAIIAKHFNKPVVVISAKSKRVQNNYFKIKGRNPEEKYLFEKVEKELITHIITD